MQVASLGDSLQDHSTVTHQQGSATLGSHSHCFLPLVVTEETECPANQLSQGVLSKGMANFSSSSSPGDNFNTDH